MPDKIDAPSDAFTVGGVRMARPFRIRRLGHFGIDVNDPDAAVEFYIKQLGFRVSDPIDFSPMLPEAERGKHGPSLAYFTRHGTEHHSFVFMPRRVRVAMGRVSKEFPEATINQLTWQVGSLNEVAGAIEWFKRLKTRIMRLGRDAAGANWHVYLYDNEDHVNELFYGIEQVGWSGASKPKVFWKFAYNDPPPLPHRSEYAEVTEGAAQGIDLRSGFTHVEPEEKFDVGGILLARPFKIVRIGPVRLFVRDMAGALAFYRDVLGLAVTEEVTWHGHRCVFLRANTEHHSLALYPVALRAELGLSPHTTLFSFGLQLGDYQQLRDGIKFLGGQGVTIKYLPPELFPGIDYSAFALDPDGHAMQLYYYMEQVGWDGRPRPERPKIDNKNWPDSVAVASDTYLGEAFLGPWS